MDRRQGRRDQARDVRINPQGCQVYSFKSPRRGARPRLPLAHVQVAAGAGRIGIFNRSYYEEVLVVRVHPEYLQKQKLPRVVSKDIWKERLRHQRVRAVPDAQRLHDRKFFLNVSKKEQKKRFLERLEMDVKTGSSRWRTPRSGASGRSTWRPTRT